MRVPPQTSRLAHPCCKATHPLRKQPPPHLIGAAKKGARCDVRHIVLHTVYSEHMLCGAELGTAAARQATVREMLVSSDSRHHATTNAHAAQLAQLPAAIRAV